MKIMPPAARAWPRAAVWGGAIASTVMNLSANWHAATIDGLTTFIAPSANGLHLPEAAKLVVSAAFPLLLIFAVESAARTSLRFAWKDLGSYAMPVGALTVFAFSVGEVTRLLLGMGQPWPLALLFALAPDILITAGTVVLMRERAADAAPSVPEVAAEQPATAPEVEPVGVPEPTVLHAVDPVTPTDDEIKASIRALATELGALPTVNAIKSRKLAGTSRATRLLAEITAERSA